MKHPAILATGILAAAGAAVVAIVVWRARRPNRRNLPPGHTDPVDSVIEISALAGGLAHEIRNPLSTLKVNLQLLGEDWSDESVPVAELRRRSLTRLKTLGAEATRLNHIVEDFLRLVGRQELNRSTCDLTGLVQKLVEFYEPQAKANGVQIRFEPWATPLLCAVDADLVRQAMLNLCINAQEAMPQGGILTIRTRAGHIALQGAASSPNPLANSPAACVDFHDTGPGLSADALHRVFEPYYSTKPRGTGLGLALTRRIIRAHGGAVTVSSSPGTGAVFTLALPLEAS